MRSSRSKITYLVGEDNRLIAEREGQRVVLDGTFTADDRNRLVYQIDGVAGGGGLESADQVALTGRWGLTNNRDLSLTLDAGQRQRQGETLVLSGKLLAAEADALAFRVEQRRGPRSTTSVVALHGRWQADERNRLVFLVRKADGDPDRVTFEGAWEVGKHHALIYRYTKRELVRKTTREEVLSFRGAWEISDATHLTYRLDRAGESAFRFRAALQSPSVIAKQGAIKYQVGIEVGSHQRVVREVTFFGVWKLGRKLAVRFELRDGAGRRHTLEFGAEVRVTERDRVTLALTTPRGRPVGVELTVTRRFFDDAEGFVRFRKTAEEAAIEAGLHLPF